MADTDLYDPDTGTPLIGRWPLDMALQHARDHDHANAGYDSHMRAALRAIDLLEAELRRIAADGEQVAEFAVPGAGLREEYRPSLPQTDELIELASASSGSTPDTGSTNG